MYGRIRPYDITKLSAKAVGMMWLIEAIGAVGELFGRELVGVVVGAGITYLLNWVQDRKNQGARRVSLEAMLVHELELRRDLLAAAKAPDEFFVSAGLWDAIKIDLALSGLDPRAVATFIGVYEAIEQWNRQQVNETYGGGGWTRPKIIELLDRVIEGRTKSKRLRRVFRTRKTRRVASPQ